MPFNGSGIFSRLQSWVARAAAGNNISPAEFDADGADVAAGLSNCLTLDGQSTVKADLPMSGHSLTGLRAPVAAADASTKAYADGLLTGGKAAAFGNVNLTNVSVSGFVAAQGSLVTRDAPGSTVGRVYFGSSGTIIFDGANFFTTGASNLYIQISGNNYGVWHGGNFSPSAYAALGANVSFGGLTVTGSGSFAGATFSGAVTMQSNLTVQGTLSGQGLSVGDIASTGSLALNNRGAVFFENTHARSLNWDQGSDTFTFNGTGRLTVGGSLVWTAAMMGQPIENMRLVDAGTITCAYGSGTATAPTGAFVKSIQCNQTGGNNNMSNLICGCSYV